MVTEIDGSLEDPVAAGCGGGGKGFLQEIFCEGHKSKGSELHNPWIINTPDPRPVKRLITLCLEETDYSGRLLPVIVTNPPL